MSDASDERKKWMASLAAMTYPQNPGQAAEAYRAYLPMLADLPDAAFTRGSLVAVSEYPRKMAMCGFNEVSIPLRAWHVEHGPLRPALPAPRDPEPPVRTPEAIAAIAALTQEATGILSRSVAQQRDMLGQHAKPPRACYASDGDLLRAYDAQARTGGKFAAAAATRAEALRAKIAKAADAELLAHREAQMAQMASREAALGLAAPRVQQPSLPSPQAHTLPPSRREPVFPWSR